MCRQLIDFDSIEALWESSAICFLTLHCDSQVLLTKRKQFFKAAETCYVLISIFFSVSSTEQQVLILLMPSTTVFCFVNHFYGIYRKTYLMRGFFCSWVFCGLILFFGPYFKLHWIELHNSWLYLTCMRFVTDIPSIDIGTDSYDLANWRRRMYMWWFTFQKWCLLLKLTLIIFSFGKDEVFFLYSFYFFLRKAFPF